MIDDILTTGGWIRDTLAALAAWQVEVAAVAVLVDWGGGRVDFGVPLAPVLRTDIATFEPAECPLCRANVPLVKPGTTIAPGSHQR